MAKTLPPASVTREERTFRVERETPAEGVYRLVIHREIITRADGKIIAREPRTFAYNEPARIAAKRPAFAAYLVAIKAAKTDDDVISAESALYDALVAEVDAERIAAEEQAAARQAATEKAAQP